MVKKWFCVFRATQTDDEMSYTSPLLMKVRGLNFIFMFFGRTRPNCLNPEIVAIFIFFYFISIFVCENHFGNG